MTTIAVAIICKTPRAGRSKTRLAPPLRPEECAEISACFIRDLSGTIATLAARDSRVRGYAVFTPAGSEGDLRRLLPPGFGLVPQGEGDFGARLHRGVADLLDAGHRGAILMNSDSPTLPLAILQDAVDAVARGRSAVFSPALDGGYVLIGLSKPHPKLFADVSWSTDAVYRQSLERAEAIGLPVVELDSWYDVDDAASYAMLTAELAGRRPPVAGPGTALQEAANTRRFVERRRCEAGEPA